MADCQLGSSAGILLLESFDKNLDRSISKKNFKGGLVEKISPKIFMVFTWYWFPLSYCN